MRSADAYRAAQLSMEELWLRYFTMGGMAGQFEIEAYLHGVIALPPLQRDILTHALNERLDELDSEERRASYSNDSEDAMSSGEDSAGQEDPDHDEQ
ncbi:hypothetical protein [Arthrobacter sp. ISL-28]|uniref:hypothetical protein n=1 Tax=Arthrobacter sp. ISL-28 TaxID=2819108 RepID=UPI00288954E0|nr:hypothetical protein [Arthrobacter sp. ISL-28]